MLTGYWKRESCYTVVDTVSGRAEDVVIPMRTSKGVPVKMGRAQLEETEHFAREWVEKTWKQEAEEPLAGPLSKSFQHDLGRIFIEVEDSKKRRDQVGHGRYW